jgi:hypothetical protein
MATGINLATNFSIPKEGPTRASQNSVAVEMFSSDLISTGAAWVLDFSVSGEHFSSVDKAGTTVSGTLAKDTTTVFTFDIKPSMYWVINFASDAGSTGSVAYSIL